MSRPQTIRLRESDGPHPRRAPIIDARFDVVRPKRTIWRRVSAALGAVFWAAVIGFAIPQLWVFSLHIGEFFAQR